MFPACVDSVEDAVTACAGALGQFTAPALVLVSLIGGNGGPLSSAFVAGCVGFHGSSAVSLVSSDGILNESLRSKAPRQLPTAGALPCVVRACRRVETFWAGCFVVDSRGHAVELFLTVCADRVALRITRAVGFVCCARFAILLDFTAFPARLSVIGDNAYCCACFFVRSAFPCIPEDPTAFTAFFCVECGECVLMWCSPSCGVLANMSLATCIGQPVRLFVASLMGVSLYPLPLDVMCCAKALVEVSAEVAEFNVSLWLSEALRDVGGVL